MKNEIKYIIKNLKKIKRQCKKHIAEYKGDSFDNCSPCANDCKDSQLELVMGALLVGGTKNKTENKQNYIGAITERELITALNIIKATCDLAEDCDTCPLRDFNNDSLCSITKATPSYWKVKENVRVLNEV